MKLALVTYDFQGLGEALEEFISKNNIIGHKFRKIYVNATLVRDYYNKYKTIPLTIGLSNNVTYKIIVDDVEDGMVEII